jgi:hypothetical protein
MQSTIVIVIFDLNGQRTPIIWVLLHVIYLPLRHVNVLSPDAAKITAHYRGLLGASRRKADHQAERR